MNTLSDSVGASCAEFGDESLLDTLMECGVGDLYADAGGDAGVAALEEILMDCGVFPEDTCPETLLGVCGEDGTIDPALWARYWAKYDSELRLYLAGETIAPAVVAAPKKTRSHTSLLWRYANGKWERKDPLRPLPTPPNAAPISSSSMMRVAVS